MPITFHCECGKSYRVGDEFLGRRVRCKGCGKVVRLTKDGPVPVSESAKSASSKARAAAPSHAHEDEGDFGDLDLDDDLWNEREANDWADDGDEQRFDDDWDDDFVAQPKRSHERSAGSTRRSKSDVENEDDENEDVEPVDDDSPWSDFVWAGGLAIAAIVAFLFLQWMEMQGDDFTGEGGRGLTRFLAFVYQYSGKWGVSVVFLLLSAFFASIGWSKVKPKPRLQPEENEKSAKQSKRATEKTKHRKRGGRSRPGY